MQSFVTESLYVRSMTFPARRWSGVASTRTPRAADCSDNHRAMDAKVEKIADALAALPLDELARSPDHDGRRGEAHSEVPEVAALAEDLDGVLSDGRGLVRRGRHPRRNVNCSGRSALQRTSRPPSSPPRRRSQRAPALVADARRVVAKIDTQIEPLLASLKSLRIPPA